MCDALPYQVDYAATSFADGFVYRADEDMLVPADLFAGCCHRYIEQPSAGVLDALLPSTPALDAMLHQNNITGNAKQLLLGLLGGLQHLRPPLAVLDLDAHLPANLVTCFRVLGHEEHPGLLSLVACVVPTKQWCRLRGPTGIADRIKTAHQAGCMLIVAEFPHLAGGINKPADVDASLRLDCMHHALCCARCRVSHTTWSQRDGSEAGTI
jgi:hypothetical protein